MYMMICVCWFKTYWIEKYVSTEAHGMQVKGKDVTEKCLISGEHTVFFTSTTVCSWIVLLETQGV